MGMYVNLEGTGGAKAVTECWCSPGDRGARKVSSIWAAEGSGVAKVWESRKPDPYALAPENEEQKWDYTLDNAKGTIQLNYYSSNALHEDVIVYGAYGIGGKTYRTKLKSNDAKTYSYMFSGKKYVGSVIFSPSIDMSDVTCMTYMFYDCGAAGIDFNGLDTGGVTDMSWMFIHSKAASIKWGDGFDTSNVTDMRQMFGSCCCSLDLGSFNTGKVTKMQGMFANYGGEMLDLSSFDTGSVTSMQGMFAGAAALKGIEFSPLFDTGNVVDMGDMFGSCSELTALDLRYFDTGNVKKMRSMFLACSKLGVIYADEGTWKTSQADTYNMFNGCGTSAVTYI